MISQNAYDFADSMEQVPDQILDAIPGALEICIPVVTEGITDNFSRQQSPDGIAWPARKRIGDGHPLLIETNTEHAGSLFAAATGRGAGHVCRVDGDALLIGVDKSGGLGGIPGAGVHNYGFPSRKIPQRQFLGIDAARKDECGDLIADFIIDQSLEE